MTSSAPAKTATSTGSGGPAVQPLDHPLRVTEGPNGLTMGVRVSPSAKQTRLRGLLGDRLKVQIAAPPEDGRANEELLAALASWLQVPRAAVSLTQGSTGKDKLVTVSGISRSQLAERVSRLVART